MFPTVQSVRLRGRTDGLWLVVGPFEGARTDYAREGKDRTDYRGLVMGTIMLDHKMGGMLDHDLIEENL